MCIRDREIDGPELPVVEGGVPRAAWLEEKVPTDHGAGDERRAAEDPRPDDCMMIALERDVDRSRLAVVEIDARGVGNCLLYTSPSPRDRQKSRMPSSA